MQFPTGGDLKTTAYTPCISGSPRTAKQPIRCDSGTDSTVWMKGEIMENNKSTKTSAKSISTSVLAGVGILSALAFILQYLEISLPIMPFFIKFDFSDLPALIGAYAYGPVAGILIEFIKNLLHCAVSQSATVGELSNFILGAVFCGIAGLIYKRNKTKKTALIGGLIGAVAMGIICIPSNYYVVYPFYYKAFMPEETVLAAYQAILPNVKSILQSLFIFNLPFTVVKGLISVAISMPIYKRLMRVLNRIGAGR